MAVYVDDAVWEWRGRMWCHLIADTLAELHFFAQTLGLRAAWFQSQARFPHYDITAELREKALQLGAQSASRQTVVTVSTKLREEFRSVPRTAVQLTLL